jgi:ribosomal protein L17
MVLGHTRKAYKHMMRNILASLIIHERIETTHAKVTE